MAKAQSPAGGSTVIGATGDFARFAYEAPDQANETLASFAAAGATTLRFPVDWAQLQPKLSQFNWTLLEPLYRELLWTGMKAIPVIVNTGSEHGLDRLGADDSGISSIQNPLQTLAFALRGFFARYRTQIGGLEVWSEPNGSNDETKMSASVFQRVVSTVSESVISFDGDEVPVIAGGLVVDDAGSWEKYVVELELSDQDLDDVALHIPAPVDLSKNALSSHYLDPIDKATDAGISRVWVSTAAPVGLSDDGVPALVEGWREAMAHPSCAGFLVASNLHEDGISTTFDGSIIGENLADQGAPGYRAAATIWGS